MLESERPIEKVDQTPKGHRTLLKEFKERNRQEGLPKELPKGELLEFNLGPGEDATRHNFLNPAPVIIDGEICLWVRVDKGKKEEDSVVMLFKEGENGKWDIVKGAPVFDGAQDPFYCGKIGGDHIFGVVRLSDKPCNETETKKLGYETVLYRYRDSLDELKNSDGKTCEPFVVGPKNIKGLRVIQIGEDRIGVFWRPQKRSDNDQFGGRGQIGYFEIKSLGYLKDALKKYDLQKDPDTLIKGLFIDKELSEQGMGDEEWGGANQLFLLPDGRIEVLGHIAGFGDKSYIDSNGNKQAKKDYYTITFIFDPEDKSVSDVQIIVTAEQFDPVEVTKDDLGSVDYPGGRVVRPDNGEVWLYVGIGERRVGRI